jgi:hypothetical protein
MCYIIQVLGQFLEEALKMLETIKEGLVQPSKFNNYLTTVHLMCRSLSLACSYLSFHTRLSSEAQKLPAIILQQLDSYDSYLCKYLGVDRAPPKVTIIYKPVLLCKILSIPLIGFSRILEVLLGF